MNTPSEISGYVIKCQEMAGKIEERARAIAAERDAAIIRLRDLSLENQQWQAFAESLNLSFKCGHKGPEDCMNLARHVDEVLEENHKLKLMLRYCAYFRVNALGETPMDKLDEVRASLVHKLLEGDEPEPAEPAPTCEHDWHCEGADRDGNWVAACRKCGQIRE